MTDNDDTRERLATLEANEKHHAAKLKTLENRHWGLIAAAAAWAFNFISKKVGL